MPTNRCWIEPCENGEDGTREWWDGREPITKMGSGDVIWRDQLEAWGARRQAPIQRSVHCEFRVVTDADGVRDFLVEQLGETPAALMEALDPDRRFLIVAEAF